MRLIHGADCVTVAVARKPFVETCGNRGVFVYACVVGPVLWCEWAMYGEGMRAATWAHDDSIAFVWAAAPYAPRRCFWLIVVNQTQPYFVG